MQPRATIYHKVISIEKSMLSSMMTSSQMNGKDWPVLGGRNSEGNDWELLDPTEEESSADTPHHQEVVVMGTNRVKRQLRHCASSPNLNQYDFLDAVEEEGGSGEDHEEESRPNKDDSSYSMVSGPKSVMSMSSGFSFRDAILSPSKNDDMEGQQQSMTVAGVAGAAPAQTQRRVFKPKFVVKPIRRCSKSTGDLQSLHKIAEEEDVLGETDAMDFYHRKAAGARNRTSGLKMRPDEMKRKEITLYKKALQQSKNR